VGAYKTLLCLGLDFMPPDQIGHMSLNGLKRRVATHDKTQTETRMGEPSVALDPEHRFQLGGGGLLSFCPLENHILEYLRTLGFFSMLITYV
jgi:hypothetical protein